MPQGSRKGFGEQYEDLGLKIQPQAAAQIFRAGEDVLPIRVAQLESRTAKFWSPSGHQGRGRPDLDLAFIADDPFRRAGDRGGRPQGVFELGDLIFSLGPMVGSRKKKC